MFWKIQENSDDDSKNLLSGFGRKWNFKPILSPPCSNTKLVADKDELSGDLDPVSAPLDGRACIRSSLYPPSSGNGASTVKYVADQSVVMNYFRSCSLSLRPPSSQSSPGPHLLSSPSLLAAGSMSTSWLSSSSSSSSSSTSSCSSSSSSSS